MKKTKILLFTLLVLISTATMVATGKPAALKSEKPAGNDSKSKITLDILNCKPGVYKTYEDFEKGTPLNLKFVVIESKFDASEKLIAYQVVFKDEHGGRVAMSPTEFWGFTNDKNQLCRSVDYTYHSSVPKICFYVNVVNEDFIIYEGCNFALHYVFFPRKWYSEGLNTPVEGDITFLKTHDKNKIKKFEDAWVKCNQSGKKNKDLTIWYRSILDCYETIPGFVAIFDEMVRYKPKEPSKYMR